MYFICTVIMVCINLGNSLGSTKNQSPKAERFHYFDAELLQVFNQKENSNVLISPISIKLVLGMLVEGAEDETATEIREALRLPDDDETIQKEFTTWLSMVPTNDSTNIMKLANRVFLSNRYSINSAYGKALTKYYSGGVTNVKFENANETCRVINSWVGNQTSQLIDSIIEEGQISPDSKLVLASAVYFKGTWSNPFVSERTAVKCFYTKGNKCKDSLMMSETGYFDYGYISRLDAKAIVLPYKGGGFSMLILLPTKREGVRLLTRDLLHVNLDSILSELKEEEVYVQLPQFEINYNDDMVKSLKNVQITEVFTPRANLSKMFTSRLESASVSHVYHSAKIIVNEEGSEAAAATGAMFVPLMGGTTTAFVANHPFLFFIISTTQKSILFAGKVVSPQAPDDSKTRLFSSNTVNQVIKKTQNHLQSNQHSSSRNDTPNRSFDRTPHELKTNLRGQQFKSVKPYSTSRGYSTERKISFENSSRQNAPNYRALPSSPSGLFEKESQIFKKRGKTIQEPSKNRKRVESDDWRHRVLFFT